MKQWKKIVVLLGVCVMTLSGCKSSDYQKAVDLYSNGEFQEAKSIFTELGDYKDSADMIKECDYAMANALAESKDYDNAIIAFKALGDYKDSAEKVKECEYAKADAYAEAKDYDNAITAFTELGNYKDSADRVHECRVQKANDLLSSGDYLSAAEIFGEEYKAVGDSAIADSLCSCIQKMLEADDNENAEKYMAMVKDYSGAKDVQNLAIFLNAEKVYKSGLLNTALAAYELLPETFSYGDVIVSDRIEKLESHSDFLAVCGEWSSSGDNGASISQISSRTGAWDGWDFEVGSGSNMIIKCVINEDDTVTMEGVVPYPYCSNYSSLSSNIKINEGSKQFSYTGDSLPDSIEIEDGYDLSCSEDEFRLDYKVLNTSVSTYFDYELSGYAVFDEINKR